MSPEEPTAPCLVCDKHSLGDDVPGGVLYDDGLIYAGHSLPIDTPDVALGYLMVEPRRHVAKLGDLTDEEAAGLMIVANRLANALRDCEKADHVYSFVFGERIPHLHLHLAPRYADTPRALRGLQAVHLQRSPHRHRGDVEEMTQVCDRLRSYLDAMTD